MTDSKTIMVVDDEPDTVYVFQESLKLAGYNVIAFTKAQEAFTYLALHPKQFDLIISDIKMPFMDGIEFARKVRKQLPELRIVLVTAYEYDDKNEELESIGVREIARKPLSGPKLLGIAARHVRKKDEILDCIYLCNQCRAKFLFLSDVGDHEIMSAHFDYREIDFSQ